MTSRSTRHQPFTIYADSTYSDSSHQPSEEGDYEHRMSTSPSPYDADHGSDDNEVVLPSIEEAHDPRRSSAAFTNISSLPPSLPYNSDISPYTPHSRKGARPAFRSPASVRAMQMSSPPPFHQSATSRMGSPRRAKGGTPSSLRSSGSVLRHTRDYDDERSSVSRDHDTTSGRNTPSGQVQMGTPTTRGPLVLLHVTVLPGPAMPYSVQSLQELAPNYVLQNWYMLQEKLTETVLTRGVLIPHPGEEFDLLEEGLLETLGLCAPRIGSCGHFYVDGGDDRRSSGSDSDSGHDSGVSDVGGGPRQLCEKPHRWSAHSRDVEDTCIDCEGAIRIPGKGIGSGTLRWEIKIYAANGLMRAGAWAAAYREMERVDVEIEPWIPEDVRRALDLRLEQEQDELRKERDELERLRFDYEVMERLRTEADEDRSKAEQRAKDLEQDLELAKIVVPPLVLPAITAPPATEESVVPNNIKRDSVDPTLEPQHAHAMPGPSASPEIPLSTLLRNYVKLLAQDRRNVALGLLSVLVIFMSLRLASTPQAATITPMADTMSTQLGNTIQPFDTSPSRHLAEDTNTSMQSASSSPIAEAIYSKMAQSQAIDHDAMLPSSSQTSASIVPAESPIHPQQGAATAGTSSLASASVPIRAEEANASNTSGETRETA